MKTRGKSGLIVFFDERSRRDLIKERIEGSYEAFSDALSLKDWEMGELGVALLSFSESSLDYIALAKRGKRVATSKFRIEFSAIISLEAISISAVETKLDANIRRHFLNVSRGTGGSIPEATWAEVIKAIKNERPRLKEDIDRLLSLRRYSGFRLYGKASGVLTLEREALGISLDIFSGNNQLRDVVLREWAPSEESITNINESGSTATLMPQPQGRSSFLSGIAQRYLQEESAIQHDLFNWQGMTPFHEAGVSVFSQGSRRLEVIYANRNALEGTLGVDLIYYNNIMSSLY